MAKGNMLQGQARGSVGDVTFAVLKGQQISKMRNRKPANPKTQAQMTQRAFFANAVKFFTRGNQNMFKFAYEDKKNTESDFNAFMRRNVANGVMISPTANKMSSYPALGKFVMSSGSITFDSSVVYDQTELAFVGTTEMVKPADVSILSKIGATSKVLVNAGLHNGDIITTLVIVANGSTFENTPWAYPTKRGEIQWLVSQFVVNTESTETLTGNFRLVTNEQTNKLHIHLFRDNEDTINGTICGAVCIVSRNTESGLAVNNTVLALNKQASDAYEDALTNEEYLVDVLNDWGSADKSILQGGL